MSSPEWYTNIERGSALDMRNRDEIVGSTMGINLNGQSPALNSGFISNMKFRTPARRTSEGFITLPGEGRLHLLPVNKKAPGDSALMDSNTTLKQQSTIERPLSMVPLLISPPDSIVPPFRLEPYIPLPSLKSLSTAALDNSQLVQASMLISNQTLADRPKVTISPGKAMTGFDSIMRKKEEAINRKNSQSPSQSLAASPLSRQSLYHDPKLEVDPTPVLNTELGLVNHFYREAKRQFHFMVDSSKMVVLDRDFVRFVDSMPETAPLEKNRVTGVASPLHGKQL